jgi:hypothetical protein
VCNCVYCVAIDHLQRAARGHWFIKYKKKYKKKNTNISRDKNICDDHRESLVQQILMVRSFVPPYTTTAHEKVKLAVRCLFGNPSVSAAAHKKGSKKHILGALKKIILLHFTTYQIKTITRGILWSTICIQFAQKYYSKNNSTYNV